MAAHAGTPPTPLAPGTPDPAAEAAPDRDLSRPAMAWLWGGILIMLAVVISIGTVLTWRSLQRSANRIVCFGDSLTTCGGYGGRFPDYLALALPDYEVINRGVGGDTLERAVKRFQGDVIALHPKVVLIELGANDWHRNERPIEALRQDLEDMVSRAKYNGIEVILLGVFGDQLDAEGHVTEKEYEEKEAFGQAILQMEREIAKKYDCPHIENIQYEISADRDKYWESKNHPNADGNRLVAQRILPVLKEVLEKIKAHEAAEAGK